MVNENEIMIEIYEDILNKIEYIKASKLRLDHIKNNINFLNNNYFDTKFNNDIFYKYLNMFDNTNNNFINFENLITLKYILEEKLSNICDHEWEYDLIDIGPDRSMEICYCLKCEITKK
jgi:S-ribosylhomocysteine lyase LuxS involved in autoinducer biosynthesis